MNSALIPLLVALYLMQTAVAQDAAAPDACTAASCAPSQTPKLKLPSVFETIVNGTRDSCPLSPTCANNGYRRLWAQRRIGADLMTQELRRIGVPDGSVNISILDTGFDAIGNRKNIDTPNFKAYFGTRDDTDRASDHEGHGTSVLGVISGKDGIGVAAGQNASSHVVIQPGTGISLEVIERACKETQDILNLSATSYVIRENRFLFFSSVELVGGEEHDGDQFWESTRKGTLDVLTQNGCLLVQNAGNLGQNGEKARHNLDNAVLRVESISPFSLPNQRSSFSSVGEVRAPGEDVYSLASTGFPKLSYNSETKAPEWIPGSRKPHGIERCDNLNGAFVTGTSFASPLVAGIAAQVKGVLKTGSRFTQLDAPTRIKLTNRIIAASTLNNSINGYRAVLMAERWRDQAEKSPTPAIPSVKEFADSMEKNKPSVCAKPPARCSSLSGCGDRRSCMREARAYAYACASRDPSFFNDLITTAQKSDDLELIAEWLNALHEISPEKAVARAKSLHLYADSVLTRSDFGGAARAISFLAYQRHLSNEFEFKIAKKIRAYIKDKLLLRNDSPTSFDEKVDFSNRMLRDGQIDGDFVLGLIHESPLDEATQLLVLQYGLSASEERLSKRGKYELAKKLLQSKEVSSRLLLETTQMLNRLPLAVQESDRRALYEQILSSPKLDSSLLPILAAIPRTDDDPNEYEDLLVKIIRSPKHTPESLKATASQVLQPGRGRYFKAELVEDYGIEDPLGKSPLGSWVKKGDFQILAKAVRPESSAVIAEATVAELEKYFHKDGQLRYASQLKRQMVKFAFESFEVSRGFFHYLSERGITREEKMRLAGDPQYLSEVYRVVLSGLAESKYPVPAAEDALLLILKSPGLQAENFKLAAVAAVSSGQYKRRGEFLDVISASPLMDEEIQEAMLDALVKRKAIAGDPALRLLIDKKMVSDGVLERYQKSHTNPETAALVQTWRNHPTSKK